MNIIVASNYKLGDEAGTAFVAENLFKYLAKNNNVIYVCLGEKFKISKINKRQTIIKIPSVDIGKASVPLITPNVVYKLFTYLSSYKIDIIHAQNSLFVCNLLQIWANLNKIPFLVTFHHIPTQFLEHLFPKLVKNIFSDLVQDFYKDTSLKNFLNHTDGVIALNKYVLNSVRSVDKTIHTKIINNGLDLNALLKIKINNKLGNKIRFLFVGSYNERKNQELLLNTFSYLPKNYILHLYGKKSTGGFYFTNLMQLKKRLKLKNIYLHDYSNDLKKIYCNTDFFLSASVKEAQSLAVIQSLASAKPVIGLENETISELIDNKNGLVLPKSITAKNFANRIKKYVDDINYKEIASNARNNSKKFRIEKVILDIKKMYESTSYSHSKKSRGDVGEYYQDIFKSIVFKK